MGSSVYDSSSRAIRADKAGYATKSKEEIFAKSIHETLDSRKVVFRECRDSNIHPEAIPVIIALDVTGSMGRIPHNLIKTGLPHIMQSLIDSGIEHCSVCFIAVGDHISDKFPMQIAQFESGDLELDTHLQRTFLEGNGGGNGGNS
jgi:hypothetical protein